MSKIENMVRVVNIVSKIYFVIILGLVFSSCKDELFVSDPNDAKIDNVRYYKSLYLEDSIKTALQGVYKSNDTKGFFSNPAIVKWVGNYLCMYTKENFTYFYLLGGVSDTSLIFSGNWRASTAYLNGTITLSAPFKNIDSLKSSISKGNFKFKYSWKSDNSSTINEGYIYFSSSLKNSDDFVIFAHRGGGKNGDNIPFSENSTQLFSFSEILGANAIEIDVQKTRDNIPIILHDDLIATDNISSDFCVGKISNYTLNQIQTLCRLPDGSKIPILEDVLKYVVNNTTLKYVWIDQKAPEIAQEVVNLVIKYNQLAMNKGRNLQIFYGIDSEASYESFLSAKNSNQVKTLNELEMSKISGQISYAWAPEFDNTIQQTEIASVQSQGKKVFLWIINSPYDIITYYNSGIYPDGVISNYPAQTYYEKYFFNN